MNRFLRLLTLVTLTTAAVGASAEPINLRCTMRGEAGKDYDLWVMADPAAFVMVVDGKRGQLETTANRFNGTFPKVGGFSMRYSIDRDTGVIRSVSTFFPPYVPGLPRDFKQNTTPESGPVSEGRCEKAEPPVGKLF